jgi:glutamate formiminotransferase
MLTKGAKGGELVECVPNFSEGRRRNVVEEIRAAIASVDGVRVLDVELDADHNRSVVTIVGPGEAVKEAAFLGAEKAVKLIDLRTHVGAHPRLGAVDVIPFIPIRGVTPERCVGLARSLANDIWTKLQVPVYYYEDAAVRADRRNLEVIRKGQFEGLREAVLVDGSRAPDVGDPRLHESAGAVVIGARMPLIAYNVNLDSADLGLAKTIAKTIRESSGGIPKLKAMGVDLKARGIVQVSMNLTDYRVTPPSRAFDAVHDEALKAGVKVVGSEIVGLVPEASLPPDAIERLRLENFTAHQILERRLEE